MVKHWSAFQGNWLAFSVMQVQKSRLQKKLLLRKKTVGEPKAGVQKEKELTLEDVRAICADKACQGYTAQVKAIINQHGVGRLSDVNPVEYKTLLAEVEVLGNAG